jgi:hypothetical protein
MWRRCLVRGCAGRPVFSSAGGAPCAVGSPALQAGIGHGFGGFLLWLFLLRGNEFLLALLRLFDGLNFFPHGLGGDVENLIGFADFSAALRSDFPCGEDSASQHQSQCSEHFPVSFRIAGRGIDVQKVNLFHGVSVKEAGSW